MSLSHLRIYGEQRTPNQINSSTRPYNNRVNLFLISQTTTIILQLSYLFKYDFKVDVTRHFTYDGMCMEIVVKTTPKGARPNHKYNEPVLIAVKLYCEDGFT